jgi:hypothetical protein
MNHVLIAVVVMRLLVILTDTRIAFLAYIMNMEMDQHQPLITSRKNSWTLLGTLFLSKVET